MRCVGRVEPLIAAMVLALCSRRAGRDGLHLRLLVDAQDDRPLGQMQVQPDDIAHLSMNRCVLRQLEGLATLGLQGQPLPDAADRRRTQPAHAGHRGCAAVRGVAGHRLQRDGHHALNVPVRPRTRRAGASFIQQAVTTEWEKPAAPQRSTVVPHSAATARPSSPWRRPVRFGRARPVLGQSSGGAASVPVPPAAWSSVRSGIARVW